MMTDLKVPPIKDIPLKFGERKFRPGALWLDDKGVPINAHGGGILCHGGKYYWFGEHKIEGKAGNAAHVGVHVYLSEDLYSWCDEGIALKVDSAPELPKGCVLERPKVIFCKATGKFVMWFHLDGNTYGGAKTGMAIADAPTGAYTFVEAVNRHAGSARSRNHCKGTCHGSEDWGESHLSNGEPVGTRLRARAGFPRHDRLSG